MNGETVLLRCPKCEALNRVKKSKLQDKPVCGSCKAELEFPNLPVQTDQARFYEEVLSWPGTVLVDFWSPTCGHCIRLNPVLDEIARENAGALKVVKVNVQNAPQLAAQFNVRGVPTLMVFQKGQKKNQIAGALQKHQIIQWIESSIS
jgi:thioredoxin 2